MTPTQFGWLNEAFAIVVRTSVILLCVRALALVLRRSSASLRHALWAIGLLSVLAFPLASRVIPKWNVVVLPSASTVSLHQFDTTPLPPAKSNMAPHVPESQPVQVRPAPAVRTATPAVPPAPFPWRQCMMWIWLLGSGICVVRWLRAVQQLRRLTQESVLSESTQISSCLNAMQVAVGVESLVEVRISQEAIPPMAWGFTHRIILLPSAALEWPVERLRVVLAHELAHIRRLDNLGQLLAQAVETIYWFNPLVWYAVHRLQSERENACDDFVLRLGAANSEYAEHLLQITRGLNSGYARAAISMATASQLRARLTAILDSRLPRCRASKVVTTTLALTIGVLTLTTAATQLTELSSLVLPVLAKPLGVPRLNPARVELPEPAAELTVEAQQGAALSPQQTFVNQYCVNCHNDRDMFGRLTLETVRYPPNSSYFQQFGDVMRVSDNRGLWEKALRRLSLGIDPPQSSSPKPAAAEVAAMTRYLESQLDNEAKTYVPPIGPHRLNRTEYGNAIRDLLDLEFDSARMLPPDDFTHGFDNIVEALDGTPRARESLVSIAPLVSRLAVQVPPNSPSYQRIFSCHPKGYPPGDDIPCAQRILSTLAENAFRGYSTPADIDGFLATYRSTRNGGGFDQAIEAALAQILASSQFLYRSEEATGNALPGIAFRISDRALASRLSFFLWSTSPDAELLDLAKKGTLHEPAVLEQQTLRMLKDYRAEALSQNFAREWLALAPYVTPSPAIFPAVDDGMLQAMRREGELFFNSIVREDRNVVDLLTADYTFVNNRLAYIYDIPNITGSQFRRVTLSNTLDVRRGLLGKAIILMNASNPHLGNRTSLVLRGKYVMTNLLGVEVPLPPPNVPPLRARSNDPAVIEPSMRQTMQDHNSAGRACVQCHLFTDPIGNALENFNPIGMWRNEDGGAPVNAADTLIDGTRVNGPAELRTWVVKHSDQFVQNMTQKLLTYALGRGVDPRDMPLARAIARDAARNNNRFSSIVLGIVKSDTFQMNSRN